MQAARAQLDMLECFAVGAKRAVVVDAAGHVGPMSLHHFAARGLLEIKNIERLGRIDQASADIACVDDKIEELITPVAHAVEQLG